MPLTKALPLAPDVRGVPPKTGSVVSTFATFEAAEVAVFVTRFEWFGRLTGFHGLPIGAFQLALIARAIVLVACVSVWALRREDERGTTSSRLILPSLSEAGT